MKRPDELGLHTTPFISGQKSPFVCFTEMCYQEHQRRYPMEKVTNKQITMKCAEAWKGMNFIERQRFYVLSTKDGERYQAEIAAFNQGDIKRKKDPNAPKRPLTGYLCFALKKRAEVQATFPTWKNTQIIQELGRIWREMNPTEREPYEVLSRKNKERYHADMREYVAFKRAQAASNAEKLRRQELVPSSSINDPFISNAAMQYTAKELQSSSTVSQQYSAMSLTNSMFQRDLPQQAIISQYPSTTTYSIKQMGQHNDHDY